MISKLIISILKSAMMVTSRLTISARMSARWLGAVTVLHKPEWKLATMETPLTMTAV